MPITFPVSPAFRFPVVRTIEFSTGLALAKNGTEQRWMRAPGRQAFALTYPQLTLAERDDLFAVLTAAQGATAQDISLTILGATHGALYFDADSLTATEKMSGIWSLSLRLCQVTRAVDAGSLGSDFPTLSSGACAQLPFVHVQAWDTVAAVTEGGRYAYQKQSAALRSWTAGGPSLSDTDATALWAYFCLARGKYAQFAYTEVDTSTRYTKCRFAADVLERRYNGPNDNAVEVRIQETP